MAPIATSTEIARPAEEVFAYVTDPGTLSEWQKGCVRDHMDGTHYPRRLQVHDGPEDRRA